jgi:hypothetical protein
MIGVVNLEKVTSCLIFILALFISYPWPSIDFLNIRVEMLDTCIYCL